MAGKYDKAGPKKAIVHLERGYKRPAIYFTQDAIDSENRFAILKTTDNGHYVRGGMLFYKFNGIEIYTEIDNIIFVDTEAKTVTVRKDANASKIVSSDSNPEERQYIILMSSWMDPESTTFQWASVEGRSNMYQYIVDNIEFMYIDPDKSIILTENVPYKDALTVTQFIKYLKNGNLVPDDDFDIDYYKVVEGFEDDFEL